MENQLPKNSPSINKKPKQNWPIILSILGLVLLLAGLAAFFFVSKDKFAGGIPWIIIAVAVLIVFIGIIAVIAVAKKKGKHEPDYYAFFVMGLIWTLTGIVPFLIHGFDNTYISFNGLFVMGVIFLIIGLANKDKWKNRKTWQDLDPVQKKLKIALIVILGVMVLLGLAAYLLSIK